MSGNLFILSAPSGGGKSSLIGALRKTHPHVTVSVSHTSRAPRPGEENGKHYHFVDTDSFKQLIEEEVFLEWAEVFGNFYGTSRLAIAEQLAEGKDVFLDIDWQGAQQIRELFDDVTTVFVMPPSKSELRQRLMERGQDSDDVIDSRMAKAQAEMSHFEEFDYLIVNDDFDAALKELEQIVLSQRLKTSKQALKFESLIKDLLAND
jgi:guanylate kinase